MRGDAPFERIPELVRYGSAEVCRGGIARQPNDKFRRIRFATLPQSVQGFAVALFVGDQAHHRKEGDRIRRVGIAGELASKFAIDRLGRVLVPHHRSAKGIDLMDIDGLAQK